MVRQVIVYLVAWHGYRAAAYMVAATRAIEVRNARARYRYAAERAQ